MNVSEIINLFIGAFLIATLHPAVLDGLTDEDWTISSGAGISVPKTHVKGKWVYG